MLSLPFLTRLSLKDVLAFVTAEKDLLASTCSYSCTLTRQQPKLGGVNGCRIVRLVYQHSVVVLFFTNKATNGGPATAAILNYVLVVQ